jgi:hypothetical protein
MANNTVKIIDKKYIEVRFVGDQSYDAVKETGKQAQAAAEEFMARDEWVRVFTDLSEQGKINTGSMRASKEVYNYGTYDRMVFVGFNSFMNTFLNGVIKASRRESSVRLENDHQKALDWLLKDPKEIKI